MKLIESLESVGQYAALMKKTLTLPDRFREFFKEFFKEMYKLGVNSIWIVIIISFFIGAVMVVQIALNVASPLLPRFTVGVVSREIILLEFSSTIMCLILAGKVGSNIASEVGTMRVTEQIDALEIMGVNSANYLILPKVTAFVAFMPVLVIFSMFLGMIGG
ncbi:MAG TPA: ABC transporter permease, partial [Dysgonamonadaceae bacterium]|nr:ABC transporter permease [Dysgonamonadaceae bacterium]